MENNSAAEIVVIGVLVLATTLANALLRRVGVPSLVGYILIGVVLHATDQQFGYMTALLDHVLEFLAKMGLVALLFRVGIESRPEALAHELPRASVVGIANLSLAAVLGYLTARYALGLELIASLAVGVAMTATSVGVSLASWEEEGLVDSHNGRMLLDVAELDDIAGIVLMGLLLAIIPTLQQANGQLWSTLGTTALSYAFKFILFAAGCLLFSQYLEKPITHWSLRLETNSGVMLTMLGLAVVIAAIAGWLGFSLAVGALFAGLVFSRDPEAVNRETNFDDIYALFAPFFFIGIGGEIELQALTQSWSWGLILALVAIGSKVVGVGLSAWPLIGRSGALLLAVSMVPRAEITMVVAQQGKQMGVLDNQLYAALVVVTAITSLLAPMVLRPMLRRASVRSPENSDQEQ
ncbi:cation:proton antiporter [Halopseudomonas sp.]|uniref:cation:proton antiporter n=1 Tax=Halopseudomonas sp. TaxID=2901191 RepID=UPI003561619B